VSDALRNGDCDAAYSYVFSPLCCEKCAAERIEATKASGIATIAEMYAAPME
jgi:hypothetical protein